MAFILAFRGSAALVFDRHSSGFDGVCGVFATDGIMDDIKFNCRKCGQRLAVDATDAGMEFDCPVCGAKQLPPVPVPKDPPLPMVSPTEAPSPPPPVDDSNTGIRDYRYWAFISYSSKDKTWGRWLHHAIETYGIPAEFVARHVTPSGQHAPKRFHPVFRDREELPASADLGAAIKASLQAARYLVVICSPRSASSFWVNAEIEAFLALGRRDRILAIIVDGEPNTGDDRECFPPALKRFEPIAADARPTGDGKTNAKLKLVAGMLGVSFDSLKQRDKQRRQRQLILRSALGACAAILTVSLLGLAVKEKREGAWQRYVADMMKVQSAWENGDMPNALTRLDAQRPQRIGDTDYRGWEWYYWLAKTHGEYRMLKGRDGGLNSAVFSSDGLRLVTGCEKGKVKTWDVRSGEETASIELKGATEGFKIPKSKQNLVRHWQGKVRTCISSDGRLAATSSPLDKTVKVWDARSGRELFTLQREPKYVQIWDGNSKKMVKVRKEDEEDVSCLCFSPDGQRLATGGFAEVNVWETTSGKKLFSRSHEAAEIEMDGTVSCICFSPDGQRLAAGGAGATVAIWDANNGNILRSISGYKATRKFKGEDHDITSLSFSPDSQRLAAGDSDKTVIVWDVKDGQTLLTLKAHENEVTAVCFSPDGRQLATGSTDQTLKVWDAASGKELFSPRSHLNEVTQICYSPDGQLIASCDDDGIVKLWRAGATEDQRLTVGSGPVFISQNGNRLAAVDSNRVRVWDVEHRSQELFSIDVVGPVSVMCFSPDGKLLAIGGYGKSSSDDSERMKTKKPNRPTEVWDTTAGKKLLSITRDTSPQTDIQIGTVGSMAFSPDGKKLAMSGEITFVCDVESGTTTSFSSRGYLPNGTVCFSPDGKQLAVGGEIYNMNSGKKYIFLGHGAFEPMAFTPDGKRMASGGEVWDTVSGKIVFSYAGDMPCFSPDGKRIAAASAAGVKLYSAAEGQELLALKGLKSEVSSISFSPDKHGLLVGCVDGTLQTWDVASDE